MSIGVLLTTLSAISLAITVVTDKLMIGDFYKGDPVKPWFVSSFLGMTLGLIATGVAWFYFGSADTFGALGNIPATDMILLTVGMVGAGMLVSMTMRSYFSLMSRDTFTTLVAMAIAATPVFVFAGQLLLTGENWTEMHIAAFAVTILSLIGFELVVDDDEEEGDVSEDDSGSLGFNWPLVFFIGLSTVYLLALELLFPAFEAMLSMNETDASLVAMPLYWFGFGLGIIGFRKESVREFLPTIFKEPKFIITIFILEIVGASFYFFEFFGVSKISATLVALITGAHILLVWVTDIYIRSKYMKAVAMKHDTVRIFFFELETTDMDEYDIPRKTLVLQAIFICLVLTGLWLWP